MNILPSLDSNNKQIPQQVNISVLSNSKVIIGTTTNIISPPIPQIEIPQNKVKKNPPKKTKTERTSIKKRERTSTVSRACVGCRKRHVKCDGRTPCARCIKSKTECIYQGAKLGRKPKTSAALVTIANQQQFINILANPAPTRKNEIDLYLSNTIQFYMNKYFEHQFLDTPINIEKTSSSDLLKQFRQPTKTGMIINAVACSGAIFNGQVDLAKEFLQNSRHILKEFFDEIDPLVAFTCSLLTMYYETTNDHEKIVSYSGSASRISQYLYQTDPNTTYNQQLYCLSLVLSLFDLVSIPKKMDQLVKDTTEALEKSTFTGPFRTAFASFCSIIRVFASSQNSAMLDNNLDIMNQNINMIKECNPTKNSFLGDILVMDYVWTSGLYFKFGYFEKACEFIEATMDSIQQFTSTSPKMPFLLQILGAMALSMGEFELLSKTQDLAVKLYPMSQYISGSKQDIAQNPFPDHPTSICFILFNILEMNTNMRETQYQNFLLWKENGDHSLKINQQNIESPVNNSPILQSSSNSEDLSNSPASMDMNTNFTTLEFENQLIEPIFQFGNENYLSSSTDEYNMLSTSTDEFTLFPDESNFIPLD